ncbi:GyrI-like domain-containing protein [Nocardia sp. NBC_01377]|uniref:GyrI-like domain-containing protein n=1 Tax=Nocardia sp. NBC_01377 TaxID=2903595 RepID=UPI003247CBEF
MNCTANTVEPQLVTVRPWTTAVVHDVVPLTGLRDFYDVSFHSVVQTIAAQQRAIMSPAFGLYRGEPGDLLDVEVGFATERPVIPQARVVAGSLPGGAVARTTHFGGFDGIAEAWDRLGAWLAEQNLRPAAHRWEVYVTDPAPDIDPADLRTELNWPLVLADGDR